MTLKNYESQLVGLFMQLWGRFEGQKTEPATILANAQNPFDNWFGDVCGEVRHRYFLIEFKQTRGGFLEETRIGSDKPHRTALYQHLRTDPDCRRIARFGHFAAYRADDDLLAFEPYAHSIAQRLPTKELVQKVMHSTAPSFELDHPAWTFNFGKFYEALHEMDLSLHRQSPPWLFDKGLGIPEADLEQYVVCMYSHLEYHTPAPGLMLLGALNPATKEFKAVALPPFQMVRALKEKFAAMRAAMAAECANQASRDHSRRGGIPKP